MKESPQKHKGKRVPENRIVGVLDLVTTCPKCGGEVGLWSEESETFCIFCQYRVFKHEGTVH